MYYKIVTKLDYECLEISHRKSKDECESRRNAFGLVLESVKETINLLSQYDLENRERDSDKDLGGYLALYQDVIDEREETYQRLMDRYGISPELKEFEDIICEYQDLDQQGIQWVMQTFILSSDYCLVIAFPRVID